MLCITTDVPGKHKICPALICKKRFWKYSGWIKVYSEGRMSNFIYLILFFVKNNLFALLENDSYKVIASFLYYYYYYFLPGEFLKKKRGGGGDKRKKRKKTRKEGNLALLLVDKLARLAQKKISSLPLH